MCPGFESRTSDLVDDPPAISARDRGDAMWMAKPTPGRHGAKCDDGSYKQPAGIRDSRERPALDRQEERESMKDKFLKAFRTDLERYCDHMSHEAKENILSFGLPTRLYSRWMGMLDIAFDLKLIDGDEYAALSDVVRMIREEAVQSSRIA